MMGKVNEYLLGLETPGFSCVIEHAGVPLYHQDTLKIWNLNTSEDLRKTFRKYF